MLVQWENFDLDWEELPVNNFSDDKVLERLILLHDLFVLELHFDHDLFCGIYAFLEADVCLFQLFLLCLLGALF